MSKRHKEYSSGSDKNRKPRAKPSNRRRSGAAASTYHRDIGGGRTLSISQDHDGEGRHVRIGVHESQSRSRHPSRYDDRQPSRNRPPPVSRSQSARDRKSSYIARQPQYEPTRSNPSYSYGVHSAEHGYGPGGYNIYAPPPSRPSYMMPQRPSRYDFHDDVISDDDNLDRFYNAPSARSMMDIVKVKAKVRQSRSRGLGIPVLRWTDLHGQVDVTKPCSDNAKDDLMAAAGWYKEATGLKVRAGDIMSMNFRRHHRKVRGRSGHTTIVEAFQPIWHTLQVTHADPRLF